MGLILVVNPNLLAQDSQADKNETQLFEKKELDKVEVNFLFNYYKQDGDHAAVTGGEGTQELDNIAPSFIINIPLDTNKVLNLYTGIDIYSSASTSNIDFSVSGASSTDARIFLNATYSLSNNVKKQSWHLSAGGSTEYDYNSISAGVGFSKLSKDENREISISAKVYMDTWKLIFPVELRDRGDLLAEKKRQSYNFSAVYSQVINKKLHASVSTDLVYQSGLLSTPFHRVFFQNNDVSIERLPDSRFKLPIGLRLHYYVSDLVIARLFYRYYLDDFGIQANTIGLELPIKLSNFLTVYPLYRFHSQTAADYFRPLGEHLTTASFYTSDYDLSDFSSQKFGFGFQYSPLYGVARFKGPFSKKKRKITQLKSIDLRYAHYNRSDGLKANTISANFSFTY